MKGLSLYLYYAVLLVLVSGALSVDTIDMHEDDDGYFQAEDGFKEEYLEANPMWGFGFLTTFLVCLLGSLSALLFLCMKRFLTEKKRYFIMKFLFSLACGALMGTAILHILGRAFRAMDSNHLIVSIIFLSTMAALIILDRVFEKLKINHKNQPLNASLIEEEVEENPLNADHEGEHKTQELKQQSQEIVEVNRMEVVSVEDTRQNMKPKSPQKKAVEEAVQAEPEQKMCCLKRILLEKFGGKGEAGYHSLIGSLLHNVLKGLIIGIVFSTQDPLKIIPVIVTLVTYEIPREINNAEILLKNQFTKIQTVVFNGLVNFLSFIGVAIGLSFFAFRELTKIYLMVFIAGNFIFTSSDIWKNLYKSEKTKKAVNILEFLGMAVGIGITFTMEPYIFITDGLVGAPPVFEEA